jgi:hypothetical protein
MNLLILLLTLLTSLSVNAQDTWIQDYSPWGDEGYYSTRNITICQDSGYAVNGTFQLDYNPCTAKWGFLIKTDNNGNFLWTKQDTINSYEFTESLAFIETDDSGFISSVYGSADYLIKRDSLGNRE